MPAGFTGQAGSAGTGTSVTITETFATPATGDVRYLFVTCPTASTITIPTGWTTITNTTTGGAKFAVAYRAWTVGVGSQNVTFTSGTFCVDVVSVSGSNPALAPASTLSGAASGTTSQVAAGVTPVQGDSLQLVYFSHTYTTGANTASLGTPAGMTLASTRTTAATSGHDSLAAYQSINSLSATGSATSSSSASGTAWRGVQLAIPSLVNAIPTVADSGTAVDAVTGLARASSVADTGHGTDAVTGLARASTQADSGTLADTAPPQIGTTAADTATSTATAASTAAVAAADSGTVAETAVVSISAADTARVTETTQVTDGVGPSRLYAADTAAVADAGLAAVTYGLDDAFTVTDHATVVELPTVFDDNIVYPKAATGLFRVIAQDHFTRRFIHWDLPVDQVAITYGVTGPNLIAAVLTSEMDNVLDLDPPLVPNRTWLHAEQDGVIKASFLMTEFIDDPQTQTRQIEGEGFSAYPGWVTYEGESVAAVQVDPADMIRLLWDHVQSYPDGNLGVQVSATRTPVKIGFPVENVQFVTSEGNDVQFQDGPYTLNWWSVTNCGDEITKLCQQAPVDFVEYSRWNASKSDVEHFIVLGYPRVGTKRTDLGFREGENLVSLIPSYQGSNDNYASDVIVIGAGTGPSAVRAISSGRIGLLRKTSVLQNQEIANHSRAQAIADFEYRRLAASRFLIENITVDTTHPNAPWGSFTCGDDILVEANAGYAGPIQAWYRITSYSYDPYGQVATLHLAPSDSFTYGAENVDPYDELPTSGYAQLSQTQDFTSLFDGTQTDPDPTQQALQAIAYVTQTAQQYLCDYFNGNGAQNGQALYWWFTGTHETFQGVDVPDYGVAQGPLADLSIVMNQMVIGKTDYGHLITGDNIQLISSDGTVGQTSNTTSAISYPKPYVPDAPSDSGPIVGQFTITDTDQSTGIAIVIYAARHDGLAQFVANDLALGSASYMRTDVDGTLTLLTGTIASMGVDDVLVIERDNSGTIQVGPGIQINGGAVELTGIQQAAAAILDRLGSGDPIGTDWSWTGQPAIVGQFNIELIEKFGGYSKLPAVVFLSAIVSGQLA